jgi:hypothetical protein
MIKRLTLLTLTAIAVFAQDYKVESVATAAPDLPGAYASVLQPQGYVVTGPQGPWCEIWLRKSIPTGAKPTENNIALPLAQGTLIGVLRFPKAGADRRGQPVKPGVYTVRYSNYPVDGAHQGVAPQRDFALLTPIANDPDPAATPNFEKLVEMSKTSGNAHPTVLSLEAPQGSKFPAVTKEGESDIVLSVKSGDLGIAIIVVGKYEG